MKPLTLKILSWAGLAIGLGGMLFFLTVSVADLLKQPFSISIGQTGWLFSNTIILNTADGLLWSVLFAAVAMISWFALRRASRCDPCQCQNPLHLRLSELVLVAFICGALMGVGYMGWGEDHLVGCALVSMGYGVYLVLGFMLAERHRIASGWRYLFVFSMPLVIHGALALGALLAGSICILLLCKSIPVFLSCVLEYIPEVMGKDFFILALACGFLRTGLYVAPFGFFLCWVAWCQRPVSVSGESKDSWDLDRQLVAQKALGWVGLAIALGGLIVFLASHSLLLPPRGFFLSGWGDLLLMFATTIGSAWYLRRTYRRASLEGKGCTPFRLLDVLVGVLACVLLISVVHLFGACLCEYPSRSWIGLVSQVLCLTVMLVVGLVLLRHPAWNRYAFAFGAVPLTFGALAAGGFVTWFVLLAIFLGSREALWFAVSLLSTDWNLGMSEGVAWPIRYGMLMLPVGAILCWLAWNRRPQPMTASRPDVAAK